MICGFLGTVIGIDGALRAQGAALNALAIALFAATVIGAALAWRLRPA